MKQWETDFKELYYKGFNEFGFTAIDVTHDEVRDFIQDIINNVTNISSEHVDYGKLEDYQEVLKELGL